jgi:hypothetical protein
VLRQATTDGSLFNNRVSKKCKHLFSTEAPLLLERIAGGREHRWDIYRFFGIAG